MIQTSADYEPFAQVRQVDCLISFEILAKTLNKKNITVTAPSARLGKGALTINGIPELADKYATLERYGWPLDGSCAVMPSSGIETGFWSAAVSDDAGDFSSPLVFRYNLPMDTDTFGWTFHFDTPADVRASRVRAVCYDAGGNIIDTAEAVPDSSGESGGGWSFHHFVQGYRAVEFTFYGTNLPRRMLRLAEVDFGVSKHFNRNSIQKARIKYGMAPDGSAFPAKQIVFVFDNSDGEFNVLSPEGVYQYWRNGQVLAARIKIGDEIVPMGMFYVTKAEIGANRLLAKVTAHDPCYQLASQKFYPLELAERETVRLDEAVPRALIGTDLDVDYGGLQAEPVSVAVRDTHDKRTIIRYLAQAARATCWFDRDNVLRFRRIITAAEENGNITADELHDWSGVSIAEEYTGVTLTVRRELANTGESGEDPTEIYNAGVADDSGTAVASYENPCVAPGNGQAVADWLLVMANRRKKYAVKNRCDPAVEIGDTLVIADAFRNDDRAVVTGLDIEYDGGLSCVTEADREF